MNRVFLHKITILACLLLLITSSIGSDKGFQTPEQYAQIIQEHFANEEWEAGRRKMPEYVLRLLAYKIQLESSKKDQRIHIIQDENNKSIVLINDIRFKSRRNIDWNEIEEYLKEYIGNTYEILETCEKIYIGNDFPDEFCHSKDKIRLKGANEKAKAKKGWYRYDTRNKWCESGESHHSDVCRRSERYCLPAER